MSEQPTIETNNTPSRREQARTRLAKLRHTRQDGMLGVPELIGLGASAIMLLAVIFSYFYFLTPARAREQAVKNEAARLTERVNAAKEGIDLSASPQATVQDINQSLESFERGSLSQRNQGRMELYNQLNEMMRKHSLRNTAGPVYTALDALGTGAPVSASKSGSARWQSLYPGIGIAVTVEGQYANLRHFMRELELSRQFIIINAVELEGTNDANSQAAGAAQVSLRLDMAIYFQRDTAGVEVN